MGTGCVRRPRPPLPLLGPHSTCPMSIYQRLPGLTGMKGKVETAHAHPPRDGREPHTRLCRRRQHTGDMLIVSGASWLPSAR